MTITGKFLTVGAVILGLIALGIWDQRRYPYHIGKAQSCSGGALFTGAQAEIVEYGLQDARGISADQAGKHVYIAEANRHVVMYDEDSGEAGSALVNDDLKFMCPDGECEDVDERDVSIDGSDAYIAEHGRGRLFKGRIGKNGYLTSMNPDETDAPQMVLSPSGIGVSPHELALTGEAISDMDVGKTDTNKPKGVLYIVPKPGKQQNDGAQNRRSLKGYQDQQKPKLDQRAAPQPNDALNLTPRQTTPTVPISAGLHRPSGVIWDESGNYVYVTDDDDADDAVRWSIFKRQGQGWIPAGFLASIPKMHRSMPRFLGIALDRGKHIFFAAGPMGLYAFRPDGESIGKMSFDEPVSGVALTRKYLYLIVGHMLCRIQLSKLAEQEQEIRPYTQSPAAPPVKAAGDYEAAKPERCERSAVTKVKSKSKQWRCVPR